MTYQYNYYSKRCIANGVSCEKSSDCGGSYYNGHYYVYEECSGGTCTYGDSYRLSYQPPSNTDLMIGIIVGGIVLVSLIVFIVVAVVYKKRRERAALMAAYANQSNQGSVMPTAQTKPNQYNRF